ncbi:TadE/TadG family type IV pilus assembly protein [Streptomyces sp. 769]|uniref:TadE/TadG family type IV pilus assembly protein n=1 Tax=Streptomyces sp. 769 TaxID=1262452 RepID=UPI000691FC31|nr:TadE/TadG family type IV pilus assembly protein [Streptomyces sp. 769]
MELVLLTPLLVLMLLVVMALGRLADARLVVSDAAHQAARAASLARTEHAAHAQALRAAATALKETGATCTSPSVHLTTGGLAPGTHVSAKVTCTAPLGDLTRTGMPGQMRLTSTASSVVDSFRGKAR